MRQLSLMRRMDVHLTWTELQDTPEETVAVWAKYTDGETLGRQVAMNRQ